MRKQKALLPTTVVDQIRLWEKEGERIQTAEGPFSLSLLALPYPESLTPPSRLDRLPLRRLLLDLGLRPCRQLRTPTRRPSMGTAGDAQDVCHDGRAPPSQVRLSPVSLSLCFGHRRSDELWGVSREFIKRRMAAAG